MKKLLFFAFLGLFFSGAKAQVLNTSFAQTSGQVYAVAVDSVNNIVYVGGSFTSFGGSPRQHIAALSLTTGTVLPWNPGANSDVYSLYVHNGCLYAGGFFTTIGGQAHNRIAKFKGPAGTISTWNPNITTGNYVTAIVAKGNKIYFAGDILLTVGTGKYVAEVDTGTAAPTSWPAYPDNRVDALSIDGNQLYIGGIFTQIGATAQSYLAKFYLGGGGTLAAWNPNVDNNVQSLCAKSGTLYAGGGFTFVGSDARNHIAEIDTASGSATTWDPGADNDIFDLEYKGGILYALGNASVFGGKTENFIGALDVTSNNATNWNAVVGATVQDAAIAGGNIFLGGGFGSILGQTRTGFAVVCINPIDPNISSITGLTDVCVGLTGVSYSVTPVAGATSYVWSYSGTGATISGSTNPATINYSVTATDGDLTVHASNGCQTSNTQTLSINTYSFTASTGGGTSITCGDSAAFIASDNYSGAGTVTYSWSPTANTHLYSPNTLMTGTHNTTTYTLNVTTSDGCAASDQATITVNPFDLTATTSFGTILCSTKDTLHVSNDYPGAAAVTYTWSPTSSLNLSNPAKPIASPITTTNYTVTATSADGCSSTPETINVFVNNITLTATANNYTITCGNNTSLGESSDYPGVGTITYTWSPSTALSNIHAAAPTASPTATATYSLAITTQEGCVSSDQVTINVDALQVSTSGSVSSTCSNTVTLNTGNNSGNGSLAYSWSPSVGLSSTSGSSVNANPPTTTVYTVTMSLPGCGSATAVDTVKILPPAVPNICEITSDVLSLYNVVYWDKTPFLATDSFIIYRETTTNVYTKIATVAQSDSSKYIDTARSITPANGDPNIGTYRYKMAVKDQCGNVSGKSPYHNTVYFVDNHTGTFTWNLYAVENATTPVTQFDLMRDNANNGIWTLVGSVTGNQTTLNDPNYGLYQTIANWRVEAQGFNCFSTLRQSNGAQGAVVKSKSNITNNRTTGVAAKFEDKISIYPNPNNGKFVVDFGNAQGAVSVKVISLIGEEVYTSTSNATERLAVDLSAYQSGIYLVQITNNNSTVTKRIVKN